MDFLLGGYVVTNYIINGLRLKSLNMLRVIEENVEIVKGTGLMTLWLGMNKLK